MTNPRDDLMAPEIDLHTYCGAYARRWAEAFSQIKARQGWSVDDIDTDLMIGWFANAIEVACAIRLAASRPAPVDREAVARIIKGHVSVTVSGGVYAPRDNDRDGVASAADAILSLLRPAEPVEAKWRPIETAPKEDPERPGRDFEIIVGGGEIKDESADLLPWRPFDSWSLACYDSMRGCWRGEQTEQYDCFYLHKPTHWMPKFAGPGQCEPTTSDAVGEPVAASPYEGKMIVDAKLLHALWCYGNLHVVEGVIYSPGSHQECLAQVNALFRERATHPPASPDTSAAILAERERCAAIADEWANKMALNYGRETANTIAAAIRQLSTTERGE